MSQVLAQVALQRVVQVGLKALKDNPTILDEVFGYYLEDEMVSDYGQPYIEQIKTWFAATNIPVVQAYAITPERIPQISIHLANDTEDEGKAAIGDFMGDSDDVEIDINVFTTFLDIGIHSSKSSDSTLWLYYIVSYILFKQKRLAEKLGMHLQTFNATELQKRMPMFDDNVYSRWIRFRCSVVNKWVGLDRTEIDEVKATQDIEAP